MIVKKTVNHPSGYWMKATLRAWLPTILAYVVIGGASALAFAYIRFRTIDQIALYAVAALLPITFATAGGCTLKLLKTDMNNAIAVSLRRLLRYLPHEIIVGIQTEKELDNVACQSVIGWWAVGDKKEIHRKIRIIYSHHMEAIAAMRCNPALLDSGVNFHVPYRIYLLLDFMGRRALKRALSGKVECIDHEKFWDGTERRRKIGTIADRTGGDTARRKYEIPEVVAAVRKCKRFVDH